MKKFSKLVLTGAAALALAGAFGTVNAQSNLPAGVFEQNGLYYVNNPEGEGVLLVDNEWWTETREVPTPAPDDTIEENDDLPVGESYYRVDPVAGYVQYSTPYLISEGVLTIGEETETGTYAGEPGILVVGTRPAQAPVGDENVNDTADEPTERYPDVNEDATGELTYHHIQQNDKFLSGRVDDEDVTEVYVVVDGVEVGRAYVNADGYYTIELEVAIKYGNSVEIFAVDGDNTTSIHFEEVVEYVGQEHTPAPIDMDAISSTDSVVAGQARPFDRVYVTIYDKSGQLVVRDYLVGYANETGRFSADLGDLIRPGHKVTVYTEDSVGNTSKEIEVEVDDNSKVEIAKIRRPYEKDQAITVLTEPYALVRIYVNGTPYSVQADGNGVARVTLKDVLEDGDIIDVRAELDGRPAGTSRTEVVRGEDNEKPVVPKVDTIVEGGTIISGKAEPLSKIEASWRNDKTRDWVTLYTMADADGKFLFDLFAYGIVNPFSEGQRVYVTSTDNAYNWAEDIVTAVAADTVWVDTDEDITIPGIGIVDPNDEGDGEFGNQDGDDNDEDDNGDKDKDKDKDKKPGKHKHGKKKGGSEDPAELPETGESQSYVIFGAAALSVLAGLGLVAPKFKKEN